MIASFFRLPTPASLIFLSLPPPPYLLFFSVLFVCLRCSQAVKWCTLSICATSARSGRVESHASRFVTVLLSPHPSFLPSLFFSCMLVSTLIYQCILAPIYLSIYLSINVQMIFRNSDAISDCICCEDYAIILSVLYPYCHYNDGSEYLNVLQRNPSVNVITNIVILS